MTRILRLSILAAVLAACDGAAQPVLDGHLTGRLDGVAWTGQAAIVPRPADGLMISSQAIGGGTTRVITIDLPSDQPGSYAIQPGRASFSGERLNPVPYTALAIVGTLVISRVTATEIRGSVEIVFRGADDRVFAFNDGEFAVER
jgi:hypothetical protein